MIRGTTPTFRLTISGDVDLTEAEHIFITIRQPCVDIQLTEADCELVSAKVISCWLTQEQSLKLSENAHAKLQVNWTYPPDSAGAVKRAATRVKNIIVSEQLIGRALP